MCIGLLLVMQIPNGNCKSLKLRHGGSEIKNAGTRFLKFAHENLISNSDGHANLKYILDRDITEHLQKLESKNSDEGKFHLTDDQGHVTRSEKLFTFVSASDKEYFNEKCRITLKIHFQLISY